MTLERSLTFIVLVLVGLTSGLIGYSIAYDQLETRQSLPKSIVCTSTSTPKTATPSSSSVR